MADLDSVWQRLFTTSLSRRAALRSALLGAATLPFWSGARAQGTATQGTSASGAGQTAADFLLHLPAVAPATIPQGVTARKGNQQAWAALQGVSIAQVEIPTGGWRAPHLHRNAPELAVVLQGTAHAALQNPQQEWLELDLQAGDCVYFPLGWPHWLRNTGNGVLQAYFNYGHEQPVTVELPT